MEFESFVSDAKAQGLFLVNSEESALPQLLSECNEREKEAEELCDIVDPEDAPFKSKYKSREILDQLIQRLDATKTVASLEGQREVVKQVDRRIASLQVKIGTISWDCEEPHNAQKELEAACVYYFPEIVDVITKKVGNLDEPQEGGSDSGTVNPQLHNLEPPSIPSLSKELLVEGLKCLNILGILWAGRGQPHKSLLYLLSASACYEQYQQLGKEEVNSEAILDAEIENAYTHNLFYLAQAYGNFHESKLSSQYCRLTLQRQFHAGLRDVKSALDWCKNCAGIADFFLALDQYHECSLALASAEKVLKEKVIKTLYEEMEKAMEGAGTQGTKAEEGAHAPIPTQKPNFVCGGVNAAEIEADLHRRWAILDARLLRAASDRAKELAMAEELGIDPSTVAGTAGGTGGEAENSHDEQLTEGAASLPEVEFFAGLPVPSLPLLTVDAVRDFDSARRVFLRSAGRIEAAKKFFLLDGYVTDHVNLLQEHSKLFHSLASFEKDYKRRLAMESRRFEMLCPLLRSLHKISFETLHKQISYELGEAALVLLDIKLDKLRNKDGALLERNMKKSDILKCNEYCKSGLALFAHFTYLYAQNEDRSASTCFAHFETRPLHELAWAHCSSPDEALITAEEVRPFLNASFLSCRILSKVVAHESSLPSARQSDRAHFMVASLRRYEWLVRFVPAICKRRGIEIDAIFAEEFKICKEMVGLLPAKIDRMCFLGESGLSL